jgi:hypothetical protein
VGFIGLVTFGARIETWNFTNNSLKLGTTDSLHVDTWDQMHTIEGQLDCM